MTTLVTGATGFIGSRLLRPGDHAFVRGKVSGPGGVRGDLLDMTAVRSACHGVERIFHCAGYAHVFRDSDPELHRRVNLEGTHNLLDAAGEAGVRRFVFLSSVKAMAEPGDQCVDEDWPGEPDSRYGHSKRAAEDAVLAAGAKYGMHVVILRLAMVYGRGGRGNMERMARGIRAGWFPRLPDTGNRRSLVHVDDVVAVARLVADAPAANGRTYIVADARPYSGREIFDTIRAVPPRLTFSWGVPAAVLRAGAVLGDVVERVTNRALPLNSEALSRLLGSACYSPARIEREIGWRAAVGLADGVREMLGVRA